MVEQTMLSLRQTLLERRREIFQRLRQFESDWKALGERESELEEEAQKADIMSLFDQLDERSKEQIEEIDLALCRMAAGTYGICENCEKLIAAKRLEALPETRLCFKCAVRFQEKSKKLRPAREVIPCIQPPDEYRNLSDEELQRAILEQLRHDGRLDLDELQVCCRRGMVYLEGAVPSEGEHQILLQILTDVMGFASIVDLLQADELLWERRDRTSGVVPYGLSPEEQKVYDVEDITEDVFRSDEEGIPYSAPDAPQPEKE